MYVICKKTITDELGEHFTEGKTYKCDIDLFYLYASDNNNVGKVIAQDQTGNNNWKNDNYFNKHFKRSIKGL